MATWIALGAEADLVNRLKSAGLTEATAFAVTPASADAQGFSPDSEEAERAAVIYASVDALTRGPRRIVVVAEVSQADVVEADDPFGRVRVGPVRWSDVRSIFVDEDDFLGAAETVHEAIKGLDIERAWDADIVHELLAQAELLWFDPTETHVLQGE